MIIKVRCPNPACNRSSKVDKNTLGRQLVCSHCGTILSASTDGASQGSTAKHRRADRTVIDDADVIPIAKKAGTGAGGNPQGNPAQIGRFQIREQIGAGAFGAVYRAYDPQLEREIALKVPHPGTLEGSQAAVRFLREAKAAGQLRHPYIVPIHEAGQDGTTYYIASAFIAGRTLADAIEDGSIDFRRAAQIVRELAPPKS